MKRTLFLLLFATVAFSCEKEYHTTIPNYPVNLQLWLNLQDSELKTDFAYKTFTQPRVESERGQLGYGGVLVIKGGFGDIYAYDLSCPVEVQRNIRVVPDNDNSNVTATCPKCGAVFIIATGTGAPQSGTKYYLRSYRVIGTGQQYSVIN